MYDACLYCAGRFDRNQLLELLPAARRVAFDGARGRLWVICAACGKWNLVPFDHRLEIIDGCERLFRDTRTRYSTDNIGLARHRGGLDLIRIGPALRPEFAAWRYGEHLRRRRRSGPAWRADPIGVVNWILAAIQSDVLSSLPLGDVTRGAFRALYRHCALRDPWTDQLVDVPWAALVQSLLVADGASAWHLEVPYRTGAERQIGLDGHGLPSIRDVPTLGLFGDGALWPTLGRLLPIFDAGGSGNAQVSEAVRLLETAPDASRLLEYVAGRPLRFVTERRFPLRDVPVEIRLAIEMAAHEETERRAMAGELRLLERQWRDADALAAIADALVLDPQR